MSKKDRLLLECTKYDEYRGAKCAGALVRDTSGPDVWLCKRCGARWLIARWHTTIVHCQEEMDGKFYPATGKFYPATETMEVDA